MAIKNMLFNHSKFLRVEKDETSSVLWFVISHVDIPPGKFAQSGVFKDIPGSKVYLNCPDNSWYQQGIPGQDDSVTSIIRTVEKFIADFSPDEVKFVGHSMGAYLALILGMHNPGSFVIATSPEFVLNLDGSRSLRNNVKPDPMWKSLIEARNADHNDIEGIVVLGVDDPVDAHFLASEEIYNSGFGSIVESPYHHGVTEFLTGLGVYRDLLTDPANAARKLRQMGVCDAPFTNGTSHQYEHFYQTSLMLRDRSTSTLEIVNRINKFPDWEHAGWQELRSRFFRASKDHQAAYSAAELAYSIRPHLPQIAVEYGRACLAAGKYIEANHLIDSLRLINPKHPLHQQLFNLADTKFALRNRHRFASYNRYPAASKRGLRVQAEFSNRPRSILREAKSLLKENDHSRLYEHLHNLNSQDEVKPELLRVAVKTTSRHRLVWLTASYLSELARQDTLTLHQLRVYLATSLRVNRLDLIHHVLPRITKEFVRDEQIQKSLINAMQLTSEPTLVAALCDILLGELATRRDCLLAAESCAMTTLNAEQFSLYVLHRIEEFTTDKDAMDIIIRICCRAGMRRPLREKLLTLLPDTNISQTIDELLPSEADRAVAD